jgi:hypothetical protein
VQYARISREPLGGSYIQPLSSIMDAMQGELDGIEDYAETGEKIIIEIIEMDEDKYNNLEEFAGW